MDLSGIKMIVSDMDGTLLNSNHEVSDRFFKLYRELKKKGILFVAASGRQYNSMASKLAPIKDDIIIIAENGAYAKKQDEVLLTTPIGAANIDVVLSHISNVEGAHPVLCTKDNAYVDGNSDKFLKVLGEYYSEFEIIQDRTLATGEVLKIAIYHFENSEQYVYPAVQQLEDQLKVKVSGSNWVDVSHTNAHKGYALQQVMETYKIGNNELVVFGDYNNDLEMLALSDYSFAMANAHPNVLKAANYTTTSNNDFGVESILEKILESKA